MLVVRSIYYFFGVWALTSIFRSSVSERLDRAVDHVSTSQHAEIGAVFLIGVQEAPSRNKRSKKKEIAWVEVINGL